MPRINKKTAALEAALDIIAAEDVSGLTYDSLAQATGMSKSGLIYHFPTRHNLLVDCHRFCAERWEEELEQLAGGHPASELSLAERSRALVLSMGKKGSARQAADVCALPDSPRFFCPMGRCGRPVDGGSLRRRDGRG